MPGLALGELMPADAPKSPETPDFAQMLGLEMPGSAAPSAAIAPLAIIPGPVQTPASQPLEAAAPEAAILPADGKPGKTGGKTLPVALLPALVAASPEPALAAAAAASGTVTGHSASSENDKVRIAAASDALPAILPVTAPLATLVEAVNAPRAEGAAAPRAVAIAPDRLVSSRPKATSVNVDLAADTQPVPAAMPAVPASASPVMSQALATLRLVTGDNAPAVSPTPNAERAAPVAAAPAVLPPPAIPNQAIPPALPPVPQAAAPDIAGPAQVRLNAKPAKAAPETPHVAASPTAPVEPSASREPLAPLAAPVLPSLAADLVMPPSAAVQPAPAQAVIAAPQANPASTDFAGLIDRLVEARDAASLQSGGAATIGATLAHAEFGRVSMQFRQDDGALSVSMASTDPGFAPAVQMAAATPGTAANEERSAARQDQQQAGASGGQNTGQNAGQNTGQSASGSQAQSNGQAQPASPRGNGQSRADEDQRPPVADPRQADGSIYA